MTQGDTIKDLLKIVDRLIDLLKIVDRLIDLLMVQSAAEVLVDESTDEGIVDAVAGYAISTVPWTAEDEVVRDPPLPDTDDPVDDE